MLNLAWNVPNCALSENIHQSKSTFSCSLSMTTSTLLTSSFIECFPFTDFSFTVVFQFHFINNRLHTEYLPWTFRNCGLISKWGSKYLNYPFSFQRFSCKQDLHQKRRTHRSFIYTLFLRAARYKLKAEGYLSLL